MREFNDTGLCVRHMHYMADTSPQMNEIFETLIAPGKYFTITGGRQFGKTTTISLLTKMLRNRNDYLLIRTSFEGIGDAIFKNEQKFSEGFLSNLYNKTKRINKPIAEEFHQASKQAQDFDDLSDFITAFNKKQRSKVVLIIDEVDKSSNNQLFLSFLGMLRDKYLLRNDGEDFTFHSVILAGVHDVKTMKLKIREDGEEKLNSPWNIAAEFNIDLSFNPKQIETLLEDYLSEHPDIEIPKQEVAEKLYYYTSGYPFLVSKMCKFIDEDIIKKRDDKNWSVDDVISAYKIITAPRYTTTLFDSIFKQMQSYEELQETVRLIVIGGYSLGFDPYYKVIAVGKMYSIFREDNEKCVIHNRIFEQRFYNYFIIKTQGEHLLKQPAYHSSFYTDEDKLNLKNILLRFQSFMKENYSYKDEKFIEREGRLLFLSFLKPIINGRGFDFKEPALGEERRMDIAITMGDEKYVVELKIWRGARNHNRGLQQLSDYLDMYSLKTGYLLIYDFNENKEYKQEVIKFKDKEIFAVYV